MQKKASAKRASAARKAVFLVRESAVGAAAVKLKVAARKAVAVGKAAVVEKVAVAVKAAEAEKAAPAWTLVVVTMIVV